MVVLFAGCFYFFLCGLFVFEFFHVNPVPLKTLADLVRPFLFAVSRPENAYFFGPGRPQPYLFQQKWVSVWPGQRIGHRALKPFDKKLVSRQLRRQLLRLPICLFFIILRKLNTLHLVEDFWVVALVKSLVVESFLN